MMFRRFLSPVTLLVIFCTALCAAAQNPGQEPPAATTTIPTIKAETRLVLVDTIVTDKHGHYIHDLTQKDFRVWEDNKEQPIKTFSRESNPAAPSQDQRRYMILFFDNSSMKLSDQSQARAAALKFLDTNAGKDRYIAVVDFDGTMRVEQNFTDDADRLKLAVRNLHVSAVSPNPEVQDLSAVPPPAAGLLQLSNPQASFGQRTLLLALRDIVKGLSSVPGRKTLVLLSSGFAINSSDPEMPEIMSELTAVIATCNRSNVAIYPIDVRGLVTPIGFAPELPIFPNRDGGKLVSATLNLDGDDPPARLLYVQHSGGGGGGGHGGAGGGGVGGGHPGGGTGSTGGSGARGGSTGGTRGGTVGGTRGGGSVTTNPIYNAPYSQAHNLLPSITNVTDTQQVLYELASGTGGFVIVNSNDLLGGLQKIAQEQTQYYVLGYTPPESEEGTCHTLKVKVDRGGTEVRSRTGYCNVRPTDLLAGQPVEKQLENDAARSQPGAIAASMRAPYFYTSANTARVNLAIEIPAGAIKFTKEKGKQHANINVLGLAYNSAGTVAARFSDQVDLNFDSKSDVKEFAKKPYHYENQFEIAAGRYNLKVVFNSGGESFGKLELPLLIDTYDAKHFSMSAVALSKELHPLSQVESGLDAALLEDKTPLVSQGMEIVPTGSDHFSKKDTGLFYLEIYDPLLATQTPPTVEIQIVVMDRKTNQKKIDMGGPEKPPKAGDPVIPVGLRLPLEQLPPGSYQLEVRALDSTGGVTPIRTANFEID